MNTRSDGLIPIWDAADLDAVIEIVSECEFGRITEQTLKQTPKGVWLKQQAAWRSLKDEQKCCLTEKHLQALHRYSTEAHQEINAYLRGDSDVCTEKNREAISALRECFNQIEATGEARTLYRGVPLWKDPEPTVPKGQFLSCTWSPYQAINFANSTNGFTWGAGRVLLEIQLPPGKKACAFKGKYPEGEYLLPADVQWNIVRTRSINEGCLITLEVQ